MDRAKPPGEGVLGSSSPVVHRPRRWWRVPPLLALPLGLGAVVFVAGLAANGRSSFSAEAAAATPAAVAPGTDAAGPLPDPGRSADATSATAGGLPGRDASSPPPAATTATPAASRATSGHAAPPPPPPPGPDLRPIRRGAGASALDRARIPVVFFPDPLRPLPEADLGILREEAAPDTSPPPDPEEKRKLVDFGKELFFSTTAFDQKPSRGPQVLGEFLSCATCHSGPAFTDNRAHLIGPVAERLVALRATPHLLEIKDSAPFGWDARNPSLENQARGAITSDLEMNGREPTVLELAALAAFVEQIKAPPAVPGVDFDPAMAAIGQGVFNQPLGIDPLGEFSPNVKISCATCHTGALFTDNKPHRILTVDEPVDPGVVDEQNQIRGFDTPPLKGLRFTAPYFHQSAAGDPTAPTNLITGTDFARRALRDNVINFYNVRFAFNFTPEQMDALTEFLLSL